MAFILGVLTAVLAADRQVSPLATESQQMRQHIDALLKARRAAPPLPLDPPNPFALASAAGVTPTTPPVPSAGSGGSAAARPLAPRADTDTSAELLARFASRLRITGLIRIKDQVHVIINDTPWREGDFIIVDRGPRIIQLQLVRIQPGLLTLRLDDAELVLRF